jgi:phosphatidate cytidylyltransferase
MEPQENNSASSPSRWSGLGTRIGSATALAVVALACVWMGAMPFSAFILLAALVMKKEWDALISGQSVSLRAGGYVYIILPCASLLWLRSLPGATGLHAIIVLVALISATDIGAYFVGKRFGRHKLAPTISPGKTYEGLAGGVVACMLVAVLLSSYAPIAHNAGDALGTGLLIALLAQGGDLFESAIKRQANAKDSGTLLPGHGGLLDRFDGYMFAAPIFAGLIHSAL